MGKVYESEIDPDEFIRSFREESSSLSTLKKKSKQDSKPVPESVPTESDTATTAPYETVAPDREQRFMEQFVWNMTYMSPEEKFRQAEIAPEFIWKIRRLLYSGKSGKVCSIKAYINNVLAAHFEEYADIINSKL